MCNIVGDIAIGIVTGVISSLCVTLFWQKRIDKRQETTNQKVRQLEQKNDFNCDIKKVYNHIRQIELALKYRRSDTYTTDILKLIDMPISTPSFETSMNKAGKDAMLKRSQLLKKVRSAVDNQLDFNADDLYFELQQLECEFVQFQERFYQMETTK